MKRPLRRTDHRGYMSFAVEIDCSTNMGWRPWSLAMAGTKELFDRCSGYIGIEQDERADCSASFC